MCLFCAISRTTSQGLGAIATATGYILGKFKLRHPYVHNMADAGEVLFGAFGRELLGTAQIVFLMFSAGSHALTGMIAFDTSTFSLLSRCESNRPLTPYAHVVTGGASCSVVWAAVTAVICMFLTMIRTLNGISYLSVVSFISVFSTFLPISPPRHL